MDRSDNLLLVGKHIKLRFFVVLSDRNFENVAFIRERGTIGQFYIALMYVHNIIDKQAMG